MSMSEIANQQALFRLFTIFLIVYPSTNKQNTNYRFRYTEER